MSTALIALGAAAGAVVGSFVAVVALRWPAGRPFLFARSACDGCGAVLRPWELVPVASHLALGGRCARCGGRINRLHLAAELAGAAIGGLALAAAPGWAGLAGVAFGWTLLALALIDLRHFWLPDRLTLPLGAAGLALGLPPLGARIAGTLAGWAALMLVAWSYRRWRGRIGLGAGDAKLFAAIGAWLGWRDLPTVLLAASLVGLGWALVLGLARTAKLPFGTLLAGTAFAVWLIRA